MSVTVKLTPTKAYPERVVTFVRADERGAVSGALEVVQRHPPPDGSLLSRFALTEVRAAGNPGDRTFSLRRPNFVNGDLVCLPADPREFPTCTCGKWAAAAWCVHVEVVRALQAENLLEPGVR